LSLSLKSELDHALHSIKVGDNSEERPDDCCALPESLTSKLSWLPSFRRSWSTHPIVFEDQDGARITFKEFFHQQPAIVVFFYTRCDNPLKCSLTITKLARIQKLLAEKGLADQIKTAAVTYDPAFDLPKRLRVYGEDRGLRLDAQNRMLRAIEGFAALREHFHLGVNFIESLVNRHRIEVYVVDAESRIAASFERLLWDEKEIVDRACAVLTENQDENQAAMKDPPIGRKVARASTPILGTVAAFAVAFFPKCPICWAAYLSMFGIAGLNQIPYLPWMQPILIVAMLINLVSVWLRGWLTGRILASCLVSAGAILVLISKMWPAGEKAVLFGVMLTFTGSILSVVGSVKNRKQLASS
jgi:protein SCO1/2